ncbi:MAG TPA: hypothetical protein GX005_09640 [Bacteroidales bacterium]|nr:hypothetical protein [Bacteroidales bacterium]
MKTYNNIINGINFSLSVEESLYDQAQPLFQAIRTIPPKSFKNGFKIEIGFSVFILKENASGYNIIIPDYMKSPFSDTTDDLTIALWIQLEQIDFLRLYNLQGMSVRFDDEIVVAKNALQSKFISLQRFPDLGGSGWCIEAIEKDENGVFSDIDATNYDTCYIYQLLKVRPELIKVMVLPYDYIVVFENDIIIEVLNEHNESIIEVDKGGN